MAEQSQPVAIRDMDLAKAQSVAMAAAKYGLALAPGNPLPFMSLPQGFRVRPSSVSLNPLVRPLAVSSASSIGNQMLTIRPRMTTNRSIIPGVRPIIPGAIRPAMIRPATIRPATIRPATISSPRPGVSTATQWIGGVSATQPATVPKVLPSLPPALSRPSPVLSPALSQWSPSPSQSPDLCESNNEWFNEMPIGQNHFVSQPSQEDFVETEQVAQAPGKGRKRKPRTFEETEFDKELVDLVQGHRVLWDHTENGYSKLSKTEEIWREIGATLGQEWKMCKDRWQDIRNYWKSLYNKKPKSGESYEEYRDKQTWTLFTRAEFIRETIDKNTNTSSNLKREAADDEISVINTSTPSTKRTRRGNKPDTSIDAAEIFSTMGRDIAMAMAAPITISNQQQIPQEQSCNSAFGNYIAKLLDSFPVEKATMVQAKLLQVITGAMAD